MPDAPWIDLKVSKKELAELETWARICAQVENGTMTIEQASNWSWATVKNAIEVTIARIRRYDRQAGHDPRRYDETWCTIAVELGASLSELSPVALEAKRHVLRQLKTHGHISRPGQQDNELHLDEFAGSTGIISISILVKNLRQFMHRRSAKRAARSASTMTAKSRRTHGKKGSR